MERCSGTSREGSSLRPLGNRNIRPSWQRSASSRCAGMLRAAAASPGLPWLSLSPVRVRRLCHTGSPIMPHRSSLQAGKPVISHTGYLSLLLCTDPSHCLRLPHSLPFFFFFQRTSD
ncbi:unnamed protein product [Tenebrio molitor]|nr:unnamed protein product [Tenebrio molitor]